MSTFESKLRKFKKGIKSTSVDTYLRNIKRLYLLSPHSSSKKEIPENDSKWLKSKDLLSKVKKEPLNIRRHLTNAAKVSLGVYKEESEEWNALQKSSMKEFDELRKERKMSQKQKDKIPKQGFSALGKVAKQMKKELSHILTTPHKDWKLKDLMRVQELLVISLYEDRPLRLDFATLRVGQNEEKEQEKEENKIFKKKKPKGWRITLSDFKTSGSLGTQEFKLNLKNQRLLNKFIPASQRLTTHGYLLSNRNGGKMSKQVLSKLITKITRHRIGKGFSVQLIRILFAMQHRKTLETAQEVSQKLMHSAKQSLQYSKKD